MKYFMKEDLKTGMIVTFRRGEEFLVLKDFISDYSSNTLDILLNTKPECSWYYLTEWNNNLTSGRYKSDDIVKIEILEHAYCLNGYYDIKEKSRKIIWEEPIIRIITIEGKDIEISEESFQELKKIIM